MRIPSRVAACLAGLAAISFAGPQASSSTPSPPAPYRAVRNCATCHSAQAKFQPGTSMAHALETIAECGILRAHPLLTFQSGGYSYRIERKGDQSLYTVTTGSDSFSVPIKYAFGLGDAGQTYVFEQDGKLYESGVSFYKEINGLDITLGDLKVRPTNVLEAAGRELSNAESSLCFNCHATNALTSAKSLNLSAALPGVQCERCHGDTEHHLEGLSKGDAVLFKMKSLKGMSAEESAHFCGQCHRTWEQIASTGPRGPANVRFQPYRLTNSRCYDPDDRRISCLACHDPHQEVDRVSQHYDSKCQACHAGGKLTAKSCPVATSNCSSCHMPKIELIGGHHKFSDHEIRIVKPNSPYPD